MCSPFLKRTFAIGDLHGHTRALDTLLAQLNPAEDRLVFLGDTVDRGPDSRGVLDRLIALSANPNHVFLRGNHDDWMLRARSEKDWFKSWLGLAVGGKETLRSYGAAGTGQVMLSLVPATHWTFLEETHFCFETDDHIFAHAAVTVAPLECNEPQWLMWGEFDAMMPHPSGKRIVVGHTPQPSGVPRDAGFAVGIDTFCSGKSWLSALDVESNEVFQANEDGKMRQFVLESCD